MLKKEIRCAATPVTASAMPTAAAAMLEETRGTRGIIVEKLLPAMKMQKHVAGIEAIANRKNMDVAIGPPMPCSTLA